MAEDGCCLCGRRLSPAGQCGCSVHPAASTGLSHPCSPQRPWLCTTFALWRGIQSNTMVGHRASAGKCLPLSLQPRPQPQGGPEPPSEEPALCQQWVPARQCSPCGSATLSRSFCVICPTWAPEPEEAQQRLLPRILLPTGEPQGVPQENRTVRYLQPDPTLGLWFPPCFLFPHRPQHLRQK